MRVKPITFTAGETKRLPAGTYFRLLGADSAINVRYFMPDGQNIDLDAENILAGYSADIPNEFGRVVPEIYSAAAQSIQWGTSFEGGGGSYDRAFGSVDVLTIPTIALTDHQKIGVYNLSQVKPAFGDDSLDYGKLFTGRISGGAGTYLRLKQALSSDCPYNYFVRQIKFRPITNNADFSIRWRATPTAASWSYTSVSSSGRSVLKPMLDDKFLDTGNNYEESQYSISGAAVGVGNADDYTKVLTADEWSDWHDFSCMLEPNQIGSLEIDCRTVDTGFYFLTRGYIEDA